ncbi:hypothetical protein D9M70_593030 [compost metagenome]
MAVHALHDLVFHVAVGHVPPPGQDVGIGQDLLGKAVLRFVESGGPDTDLGAEVFLDSCLDGAVHAIGIEPGHEFVPLLVAVLAPDGDADGLVGFSHGSFLWGAKSFGVWGRST